MTTKSIPFKPPWQPQANPDVEIVFKACRFTVLTDRLLRLEYHPDGRFENRPSQAFWFRRQPVPAFDMTEDGAILTIETAYLRLRYVAGAGGFSAESLTITLKESGTTWRYGAADPANLRGTTRTLDQVSGATRLEPGLLSRSGWAVVDDSAALVFSADGWLGPRPDGGSDLYFFGYGSDYTACLQDFQRVSGRVPIVPRYMLGNWWSRYWEYTQDELADLVRQFRAHDVPLSVCIVDMDWHIVDNPTSSGWTGYTWNPALFPDPPAFIAWLHAQGIRTALNLHPADGVHPHEAAYPAVARRVGIDPATQTPIPFDIADPTFARAYFEELHHPLEAQGVDFWWVDWQQGSKSSVPGLDPLWWLNHLHFYDLSRDGRKRPIIFSRWGGLGNHRYPIGFSGDTHVDWETLAFQPYFTATAANVGYGWWSHDIGGHMFGMEDGELYARWVQFGLFSPILRLHSTKNRFHDRRPWAFGADVLAVARSAMQWRHALIPYLYTLAWRNHEAGVAAIRPIYHTHPDAADLPQQYWFGDLLVAPYVTPADADTGLARQTVWLPDGVWTHFFTGERLTGGRTLTRHGGLDDIPVFAAAGTIVPLGPLTGWGGVDNPDTLEWRAFAGADGRFELYEDDGETTAYLDGDFALTPVSMTCRAGAVSLHVGAVTGSARHVPALRRHRWTLFGVAEPAAVVVTLNGAPVGVSVAYDEVRACVSIGDVVAQPQDEIVVRVSAELSTRDHRREQIDAALRAFKMNTLAKQALYLRVDELLAGGATATALLDGFALYLSDSQRQALLDLAQR